MGFIDEAKTAFKRFGAHAGGKARGETDEEIQEAKDKIQAESLAAAEERMEQSAGLHAGRRGGMYYGGMDPTAWERNAGGRGYANAGQKTNQLLEDIYSRDSVQADWGKADAWNDQQGNIYDALKQQATMRGTPSDIRSRAAMGQNIGTMMRQGSQNIASMSGAGAQSSILAQAAAGRAQEQAAAQGGMMALGGGAQRASFGQAQSDLKGNTEQWKARQDALHNATQARLGLAGSEADAYNNAMQRYLDKYKIETAAEQGQVAQGLQSLQNQNASARQVFGSGVSALGTLFTVPPDKQK